VKFFFRSLLVFAVAAGLGVILYFAVQALPNDSRPASPAASQDLPAPRNQTSRPERPENNRNEGIRWGSIARVARRAFLFSVIVFVTVLAKNFLFGRGSNSKKIAGR
jgi:hypothetical protein